MKLLTTTLAILFSLAVVAQDKGAAANSNEKPSTDVGQEAPSVLATEKKLDERITVLNERLQRHTILFRQKITAIPGKLIFHKGKTESKNGVDSCNTKVSQTDAGNDCLKLETFDFQDSEWGKSDLGFGSRAKHIVLYYTTPNSRANEDPRYEPPVVLKKITFNSKNVDFVHNETTFGNIDDNHPDGKTVNDGATNFKGGGQDTTTVIYFKNGFPTLDIDSFLDPNSKETVDQKGVGKYSLRDVENSKTHAIRNELKKQFLIKNLDKFDKLFTLIGDTNERYALKRYKDSKEFLKNSLKY
ncbi:MAG: hypothetical protein SFU98_01340 [Leptospiraceae bacterium]|nr:hypothetical protein [Leptospiraceae bacterium]